MINIFTTSTSTSLLAINIRDIDIFNNGRQLKFDLTFPDLSRSLTSETLFDRSHTQLLSPAQKTRIELK